MIEIKLSEIINSMNTMQKLASTSFKGKTAFQISRIIKKLDEEIKIFNETRTQLIHKYGVKDENGELIMDEQGNCKLQEDSIKDFNSELDELLNMIIEINASKLDIDCLDENNFTPADMIILEPFIEE